MINNIDFVVDVEIDFAIDVGVDFDFGQDFKTEDGSIEAIDETHSKVGSSVVPLEML